MNYCTKCYIISAQTINNFILPRPKKRHLTVRLKNNNILDSLWKTFKMLLMLLFVCNVILLFYLRQVGVIIILLCSTQMYLRNTEQTLYFALYNLT